MSDMLGQQWGNYRLTRLLGQGGFAEVYQGEHIHLKMFAAIKILHTFLSKEGTEAFQHEAQVIAELIHPNIIRVLDFDVKNGTPFLVLDYASNGSLRQQYPYGKRLPLAQVVSYTRQIASGLQYAHDHRLIHRDVKPENMLLGPDGVVLLSDFGIATIAHSTLSMSTQTSLGTLAYMAPEQIQSQPRPASDQYALAVVAYQWLVGTPPFQGSAHEIIAKHLSASPPSLRARLPDLPAGVEHVIMTALAKDPKARFPTIQTFASALEQASKQIRPRTMPAHEKPALSMPQATSHPSHTPDAPLHTSDRMQHYAQGHTPDKRAEQEGTLSTPPPIPNPYPHPQLQPELPSLPPPPPPPPPVPLLLPRISPSAEVNIILVQALIFGAILGATDAALMILERIFYATLATQAGSFSTFMFYNYAIFGARLLIDGLIDFFAGMSTARKLGKIGMTMLSCLLANSALLLLNFSYALISNLFRIGPPGFPRFLPSLLLSDIAYIPPVLLLAAGVSALGAIVGKRQLKQLKIESRHISP